MALRFFSPAPASLEEPERLAAVDKSGLLRRGVHGELQQIVEQTSAAFHTPIAAISIIDRNRQWFAARVGLVAEETTRAVSFCAHAILRPGEIMAVPDATRDDRFAGNPLVLAAPHIRFYAGAPIVDRAGYALGALCVIDTAPRTDTPDLTELGLMARRIERLIAR